MKLKINNALKQPKNIKKWGYKSINPTFIFLICLKITLFFKAQNRLKNFKSTRKGLTFVCRLDIIYLPNKPTVRLYHPVEKQNQDYDLKMIVFVALLL